MSFTRLGSDLWHWRPFLACSIAAQRFWLAFYSAPEVRALMVGIYAGGPAALAETVRMPFQEAQSALDELVERRLVEYDATYRVTRMVELPDNGERPHNGSALKRWWTGFNIIPRCAVRDRHVGLVRWLIGPMTNDHQKVWDNTFGTVEDRSGTYDTVSDTVSGSPQSDLFDSGKLVHRVRHGVGHPLGSGQGLGSGSPEGEHEREGRFAQGTGVGQNPIAATARRGPIAVPNQPTEEGPFSGREMLDALARSAGPRFHGTLVDSRLHPALNQTASQCVQNGVTLADLDLAGRFLQAGGLAYRSDLDATWAARPGSVLDLVATARDWQTGAVELETDAPKIYPAAAFVGGRREL